MLPEYSPPDLRRGAERRVRRHRRPGLRARAGRCWPSFARLVGTDGRAGRAGDAAAAACRRRRRCPVAEVAARELHGAGRGRAGLIGAGDALGEELIAAGRPVRPARRRAQLARPDARRCARPRQFAGGAARRARPSHRGRRRAQGLQALADALGEIEEHAGPEGAGRRRRGGWRWRCGSRSSSRPRETILAQRGRRGGLRHLGRGLGGRGGPRLGAARRAHRRRARCCATRSTSRKEAIDLHLRHADRRRRVRPLQAPPGPEPRARARSRGDASPSPFDLERQLLLCVPTDLPDPRERELQRGGAARPSADLRASPGRDAGAVHRAQPHGAGLRDARASGCASRACARCARTSRARAGGCSTSCASTPTRCSSASRASGRAWTCPGSALRCVVITKLPFAVPDDPIVEAR